MKNGINEKHDNVRHPAHYEVYPVQPIEITRHLGFCLGNAAKYVLRAPWKNGVEDCDKALQYLEWEQETPQPRMDEAARREVETKCGRLVEYLHETPGLNLWTDISAAQHTFLVFFTAYVLNIGEPPLFSPCHMEGMVAAVGRLRHVLANRYKDTRYAGETGRPAVYDEEGE